VAAKTPELSGKFGLLLAMIVGLLITWAVISHQRALQEQEEAARKAQRQREDTTISSLADRYHAVIDWRLDFNGDRFVSKIYSAELTPLLVRADGRPVLAIGSVRDVSAEEGAYSIQLLVRVNLSSKVIFRLQADRDQVAQIMGRREPRAASSLMKWVVVAQISSVGSSGFSEGGDANGVDETPPQSIANGRCLDLAYLGLYFRDLLFERNPSQQPSP
jgi:hypothetical protein